MADMPKLESEYDLIIVGSGGGSMPAGLVAKSLGKRAVILEKLPVVGGSTSYSGGVIWIPNNHILAEAGFKDSFENGQRYLDSCVTYKGPGVTPARRDAFLRAGPKMLKFVTSFGMKFRMPYNRWPDYYDELPGALVEGRSLMAEPFNAKELGDWEGWLSQRGGVPGVPLKWGFPISAEETSLLFTVKTTWRGKYKAFKLVLLFARDFLFNRTTITNGAAIQGRMLQVALREGLNIQRNTPVKGFMVEDGRVVGVIAEQNGQTYKIRARDGVICNVGGFSRNKQMREKYARSPITNEWTNANLGDTGEVIQAMIDLGAQSDCLDTAWWVVTSRGLDGVWPVGTETQGPAGVLPFIHHIDISLPHVIMVDQDGKRFSDESGSYMEIGERLYDRHKQTGRAIPAWSIFDRRFLERYPWGSIPLTKPKQWLESGYLKEADTLEELAKKCGINPEGLVAEVQRYNSFCETGKDLDYNRGGRAFDRQHGDPSVKPNPCLGKIEQGPFQAIAMYPGDVGTAGGVVADEFARVMHTNGQPIPGLYAIGNTTASVFGRTYPGAGASIGASFTFGFVAAHHSAGSNQLGEILS